MKLKKLLATLLATLLVVGNFSAMALAASPSDFPDFPNDWSSTALEVAVENGLLQGSNGKLNPGGFLTRAQLAAVLTRAFGAEEKASITGFVDVPATHWAYDTLSKAVAASFLTGDGANMYPDRAISRQETMVVLARALNLEENPAALNRFVDAESVSGWAKGSVGAMIAAGYVKGNQDYISPSDSITRAQFAQIMASIARTYLDSVQTYSTDVAGSIIVSTPGVILRDMTVTGDVILADGVGAGDATFSNVTVNGRLVVRGGGSDSVHITNSRIGSGVVLNHSNGATRLAVSGSTISGSVSVFSDLILEGNVTNLALNDTATLSIQSGTVSHLQVKDRAAASSVTVSTGATVTTATVEGKDTAISGTGKVGTVNASADHVKISTPNTKVVVAKGITGVIAGGIAVESGTSVTINSAGNGHTNITGSGGSSGGSSGNHHSNPSDFAGGSGTASSPWQINTAAQLDRVRNNLAAHNELTANIDLSGYANWTPIGQYVPNDAESGDVTAKLGLAFTDSFDGNSHTISNLAINRTVTENVEYDMTGTGLFGGLAGSAYIHDLMIKDATVSSNANCTAAVVGMAMSTAGQTPVRVEKISLTGTNTISGIGSVAGIVGSAQDINIASCSAVADITMTAAGNGAGLVGGGIEGGSIVNCSATGTVNATQTMSYEGATYGSVGVGGLAGCAFDATEVTNCTVTNAAITVGENTIMVGGLLGYSGVVNEGDYATDEDGFTVIQGCKVTGFTINAATGANRIGGLVGSGFCGPSYNGYYPASSAIHIIDCETDGTITGADGNAVVGSILGYAFRNCAVVSSTGSVSGTSNQVGAADAAQVVVLDAVDNPDAISKQMVQAATYVSEDDNRETLTNQQHYSLSLDTEVTFDGGNGTEENPYQIATAVQLDAMRHDLDAHYKLIADIDLSESDEYKANWAPIGQYVPKDAKSGDVTAKLELAFTGSFDGNSHTISNLAINRTVTENVDYDMTGTGLFGGLAGSAYIHDLMIKDVTVSSNANCTAGQTPVRVEKISLTGTNTISGIGSVAGIVGSAQDIDIANCSAVADITMTAAGNGAGLVGGGIEGGSIVNCSATGTVNATQTMSCEGATYGSIGVGGLAGCAFDATEVTNCTVTNAVITVGENTIMVGGLLGYSGVVNEGDHATDEDGFTVIKDCEVTGFTINAATGANRIGGLVGSGFCGPSYNADYPASSAIHIIDCKADGTITGADFNAVVGSILGYAFRNCAVVSSTGSVSGTSNQIGAADAAQAITIDAIR